MLNTIYLDIFRKKIKINDKGIGYTVGDLLIDGEFFCNTLENAIIDLNKSGKIDGNEKKIWGESAIPFGEYEVILNYSPKFKRELPRILNVDGFEGVLFHRGNTTKDTEGCILVGDIADGNNYITGGTSTKYEIELVKLLKDNRDSDNPKKVILTIY